MTDSPNHDQAEYWNTAHKWVDYQDRLDATLSPVLGRLLDEANLTTGKAVLDIGCGTGASTLAAAARVGPQGRVQGVDISPLLLARARKRAHKAGVTHAGFLEGDAQSHRFEPDAFDTVISRFGVMFFGDPVAAFANMVRALKPGGRLMFIAWAHLSKNPWFNIPGRVAADHLGPPSEGDPKAPGPMAFENRDYVGGILQAAGWNDVSVTEITLDLAPSGGAVGAAELCCRVGMAARIVREHDGTDRDARLIEERVAKKLKQFETPAGVRVPARLNLCTAVKL